MSTKQLNAQVGQWIVVGVCAVVTIGIVIFLTWFKRPTEVHSFEECRNAGGAVMESYPEQCLYNGKTFVNESQRLPKEDTFVGMEEDAALLRAQESNIPARVVERDGESLPVTMDFMPGRNNLYVKDGKVYKVEIEG